MKYNENENCKKWWRNKHVVYEWVKDEAHAVIVQAQVRQGEDAERKCCEQLQQEGLQCQMIALQQQQQAKQVIQTIEKERKYDDKCIKMLYEKKMKSSDTRWNDIKFSSASVFVRIW